MDGYRLYQPCGDSLDLSEFSRLDRKAGSGIRAKDRRMRLGVKGFREYPDLSMEASWHRALMQVLRCTSRMEFRVSHWELSRGGPTASKAGEWWDVRG